jgi:hypothetical protein
MKISSNTALLGLVACGLLQAGCGASSDDGSPATPGGDDAGADVRDGGAAAPDSPAPPDARSGTPDSGAPPGDGGSTTTDSSLPADEGGPGGDAAPVADATGASDADAANDTGASGGTLQGVYESCGPGTASCLTRLDDIATAGFKVVLNYQQEGGDGAQQLAYLDHAHSLGLKVIWSFSDPDWYDGMHDLRTSYPQLAPDCGCTDNAGFIRYVVGLVKNHPALWGYYVADEPATDAATLGKVTAFSNQVRSLDPNHPRMIIGNADVSLIQPYADTTEDIGLDIYPIQDYPTSQQCIDAVGQLGASGKMVADQHGRTWSMVLQAFSWSQYPMDFTPCCGTRWPTRAEMRGMRDQALQSSPEILLWFSYFDIQRSDDPAGHWADLVAAATGP